MISRYKTMDKKNEFTVRGGNSKNMPTFSYNVNEYDVSVCVCCALCMCLSAHEVWYAVLRYVPKSDSRQASEQIRWETLTDSDFSSHKDDDDDEAEAARRMQQQRKN